MKNEAEKTDKQQGNEVLPCVRHSAFGWFVRKPLKVIEYYRYLKRIATANKGANYDYPTINWYILN